METFLNKAGLQHFVEKVKNLLNGYVSDVQTTEVTNGNGIASIVKNGNALNVTQGAFLTPMPNGFLYEEGTGNGIRDIFLRGTVLCKRKGNFLTEDTLDTYMDDYASKKGYLTKKDMKETIVIKLVSDKSDSDTGLIGATVTVRGKGIIYTKETWQGTPIKVGVMCDRDVTIEVSTVKMYMKPKALTYTPSPLYNREVTFTYKALSLGTYIIDTNDNLIDRNSWDENTQPAVGVALITEKIAVVIPTGITGHLQWSKERQLVEEVVTTNDVTEVFNDYKGKANTAILVSTLGANAPAAYYCSNYTFKNGKKGYLMSAGEANEIGENIVAITTLLNVIDSSVLNLSADIQYWTSTQCDATMAWRVKDEKMDAFIKDYTQPYTIPIYSLYD